MKHCHRYSVTRKIISETSKYFKQLLRTVSGEEDEIEIAGVDGQTLKSIIRFICTGDAELTSDNIGRILSTASDMKLILLMENCEKYLKENLTEKNCVSCLMFADKYYFSDLYGIALELVCENFTKKEIKADSLQLNGYVVADILKCNLIHAPEKQIFNFIFGWYDHNKEERRKFIPDLLESFRLDCISKEVISNIFLPISPGSAKALSL